MSWLHGGPEVPYSFDQAFRNGKAGVNLSRVSRKMRAGGPRFRDRVSIPSGL